MQRSLKDRVRLYRSVFSTEEGKKVLEDLARMCFYERGIFSDNGLEMAYNEGRRSVFLDIKWLCEVTDEELEQFGQEVTYGTE